jgi:Ca2+-binding RTX toxin-like protein
MPVQTIDTDSLTFTEFNQQWIVKAGVVISTTAAGGNAVTIARSGGQLFNHGDISSTGGGGHVVFIDFFGSETSIFNSAGGTMTGSTGIVIEANGIHLSNQGSIIGLANYAIQYAFSSGSSEINNSGYIRGKTAAIFAEATNTFTLINSGVIESAGDAVSVGLTHAPGHIVNTGSIISGGYAIRSDAFSGMLVENTGSIIGNILLKGTQPEKIINNGLIRGDIVFGSRDDILRGKVGVIDGTVAAGSGDDSLKGGASDDNFFGEGGKDELFGRDGDDELLGQNGQDRIVGQGGDDELFGGDAGDTLKGGNGDDVLSGNDAGDKLKGGSGADTFLYDKTSDSRGGSVAETRLDTILDFKSSQGDTIDLSRIEIKIGDAVQKLDFIGEAAFSGKKGEVRYETKGVNAFVQLDAFGGKRADFEIKLKGVSTLNAHDFDL